MSYDLTYLFSAKVTPLKKITQHTKMSHHFKPFPLIWDSKARKIGFFPLSNYITQLQRCFNQQFPVAKLFD